MIDAVFISDLHLHPANHTISARFERFLKWASTRTRTIYILGDFLHVWAGDDTLDAWSAHIASQLAALKKNDISLYFMPGNRDFLIGKTFAHLAGLQILPDPYLINLDGHKVLLSHGDRYCTKDVPHQWLRRLTRNRFFSSLFLALPKAFRQKTVHQVRAHSTQHRQKPWNELDVAPESMHREIAKLQANILIHGHTHRYKQVKHEAYEEYVLSDWDDEPFILCYDNSKGFYFEQILESL